MKNLNLSSSKHWNKTRWLVWLVVILSFVGFVDATYLTFKHYSGEGVVCSIVTGCDEVLTSDFATLGDTNTPISLMGSFYYLLLFFMSIYVLDSNRVEFIKYIFYVSIMGLIASTGLIYIQALILKAFCFYCLVSAITSVSIFLIGLLMVFKLKKLHSHNL